MLKLNNRDTCKRCEMWSMLTMKTLERRHWCHHCQLWIHFKLFSSFCIADFEEASVYWVTKLSQQPPICLKLQKNNTLICFMRSTVIIKTPIEVVRVSLSQPWKCSLHLPTAFYADFENVFTCWNISWLAALSTFFFCINIFVEFLRVQTPW